MASSLGGKPIRRGAVGEAAVDRIGTFHQRAMPDLQRLPQAQVQVLLQIALRLQVLGEELA